MLDPFRGFPMFSAIHGPEQARKVLDSERVVLERVREFVQKHKVNSDFHYTTTLDVCFNEDFADYQSQALAAYKAAGGDTSQVKFCQFKDGKEALDKTRIPGAVCAYEWPAGSNNPAKLCQWILNDAIVKGAKLWTHCPGEKIEKHLPTAPDSRLRWDVHTPRGIVAAENVVHCTNAYVAYLIPELAEFVTPRKAQAQSFVPTESLCAENGLKHTLSLRYSLHNFFSLIQLKDSSGTIIMGRSAGRSFSSKGDSLMPRISPDLVTFDDSTYNNEVAETGEAKFLEVAQPSGAIRHGEGFDHVWTGILGMTADMVPLVGPIEGLDGMWICAGFNGHGEFSFLSWSIETGTLFRL